MTVKLEVGQVWEEVDSRRVQPRKFVIVEFVPRIVFDDVGCVRYFGSEGDSLAPNPRTGRKPRRFTLSQQDFDGRRFRFTGNSIDPPNGLGGYPPTKSYGL